MASAYECDRCGNLFKRSSTIEPPKTKMTVYMEEASPYPGEDAPKRLDLCPQCSMELLYWYTNKDTTVCCKDDIRY